MQSQRRRKAAEGRKKSKVWRPMAQAATIVVAVALVYVPALHAGFVWDDEQLVTGNPLLRTFSGLLEIWSGGRSADYFPVTSTVFWIEYHIFERKAVGYHSINILLKTADRLRIWLDLTWRDVLGPG